jgi:hypothetical protein
MRLPTFTFRVLIPVIYLFLAILPFIGLIITIAESPNPFGFLLFISAPGFYILDLVNRVVPLPRLPIWIELLGITVNVGIWFLVGYLIDYAIARSRRSRVVGHRSQKKYEVVVDDNAHYMDESERYTHGEFGSAEMALSAAKALVDADLQSFYNPGMTADDLYRHYTTFGRDPFIRSDDKRCHFSAWSYAKERCQQICRPVESDGDT